MVERLGSVGHIAILPAAGGCLGWSGRPLPGPARAIFREILLSLGTGEGGVDGDPQTGLIGRHDECEALDRVVADVLAAQSRALVLQGEAGIGKTALVEYLASRSTGCRVVRAWGVESEMELAFAGLHQLCATMLDHLGELPDPQRRALETAFGLLAGDPADRFMVGLAVLNLLSAAAEERPLVCLIDDAQWLDQVSLEVLTFVARRLQAESVAMVFAVRDPHDLSGFAGLEQRPVRGLVNGAARALLESATPVRLDDRVRERILAETRGNPLALLELPRAVTSGELAGGYDVAGRRPLANHLEHGYLRRIQSLPADARQLMVLAAAEPLGDAALLRRAAHELRIGVDAETVAGEEGLIEFGPQVRFRHPLVRAAAYRAGSGAERRLAHQALAEVTDTQLDPDRRAWHRAQAANPPDEDVASELERSAVRAQRRGGAAAAAAFLERATELTADPGRRARRALAAAEAKHRAAAFEAAMALISVAEIGPLGDLERARLARLRAEIVFARRRGRDDPPLLLDAARRLEALDPGLARETYLEALGAAVFAGRLSDGPTQRAIAEVASRAPAPTSPPDAVDLLLDGLASRFTNGYQASVRQLRLALDSFRDPRTDSARGNRWLWLAWLVASDLWDDAEAERLATRAVRLLRDAGTLEQLPLALTYRAATHVHAGQFTAAAALVSESDTNSAAIRNAPLRFAAVLLAAWRGDERTGVETFTSSKSNALSRGEGRALGHDGHVHAVLYNGLGRYDEALAAAQASCQYDDLAIHGSALVELVEAASRVGDRMSATGALRELDEQTSAAGTDWGLGVLARSRALLSPNETAESLHREAIERLADTRVVVQLARAQLAYGEFLRRDKRRAEARRELRAAYDLFSGMGADAFADRTRRELRAIGDTVRERRAPDAELTAQESQIIQLAGTGHTNQEIASQLFISPRTVEWHLRKVFVKLGVTSRRELRSVVSRLPQ